MKYIIYKHETPDGKVYIGRTAAEKLYTRWQYGNGYSAQPKFYNAILEFGWKNISHEILEECDPEKASDRERYWILHYRSNEPEFGYNTHDNTTKLKQEKRHLDTIRKRSVVCQETGAVYNSMSEAAQAFGVSRQAIQYAVAHNTKCAGHHWKKLALS